VVRPKVYQGLYLAHHPEKVLPKERIIHAVWPDTFGTDEVLTNAISELRKAFGDDVKNPRYIQTLPRRGYRLIAAVINFGSDGEEREGPEVVGTGIPRPPVYKRISVILAAAILLLAAVLI